MTVFYQEQAQWLYATALEHDVLNEVYTDIQLFKEGVGGQSPFMQMMTRENITNSSKANLIRDIASFFQKETQQFLEAFINEAQYDMIYQGIKYFDSIYDSHHLTIVSAVELTREQLDRIIQGMSYKRKQKFHTYSHHVDETVIGGVLVSSKDFILNQTLLAKLEEFKKQFKGE